MAANSKQKLKLLYVYKMLNEETDSKHGLSMAQIIEKLAEEGIEAERKGIYRDLHTLSEFGCNIKSVQRRPPEYTMEKAGLTLDELSMLVDVVQSSRFITMRQANNLVKKISDLASVHERDQLSRRVHVDGRVKSRSDSVFFSLDTIHRALREKRKVSFLYSKYDASMEPQMTNEGKPYKCTPVAVVFSDGFYYLVAWREDRDDFSRFRIDRIRLVQVLGEKATRNEKIAGYKLEDFAYQAFGMYDGDKTRVKLLAQPGAIDIIADRFGNDVHTKPLKNGSAEVSVTVRKSPQFFGWIAGMNGAVTIVGPKKLVQEYHDWLKSLLKDSD